MPVYGVRYMSGEQKPGGLVTISVTSAEPMTVSGLLAHLANEVNLLPHGRDGAETADGYLILVNGRSVHAMDGQDTLMADGDTVSILVPVSGG